MRLKFPILRAVLALVMLAAAPVWAQDADPIAELLDRPPTESQPAQSPSVETAPATPAPTVTGVYPYSPAPAPAPVVTPPPVYSRPAYTPPPYVPPPPSLSAPTHVDETGRSPEAPPNANDLNYEQRMRSSFASAQGMQGPLDGAWVIRAPDGASLYTLLLVDKGVGSELEGAWRDPRRPGAADSSGFLAAIQRTGSELTLSFYPQAGAGVATITLRVGADGVWIGDLAVGRENRSVTLRRN